MSTKAGGNHSGSGDGMGGRAPALTRSPMRSGDTSWKGTMQVMSSHMNTPNAYMSLKNVLEPLENSSGADHARVVAILPLPADAVAVMVANMCTAPPKSHTCSDVSVSASNHEDSDRQLITLELPSRARSTFKLLMSPCTIPISAWCR